MKISFLLIFFSLSSCVNMSVLTEKRSGFSLEVNNAEITEVVPSEWPVGPKGKQRVHRGVRVKISVPQLSKSDARTLIRKRGVDSFLIKVMREVKGTKISIGHIKVPINQKGTGTKEVLFFVDYYAAGIRSSYTRYVCPPYNHDYKVFGLKIKNHSSKIKNIGISAQYEKSVRDARNIDYQYSGQHFIAGRNVLGRYFLKIALYDSGEKTLKSEYFPYNQYFSVDGHERHSIKGCPSSTGDGILQGKKNFKFKR